MWCVCTEAQYEDIQTLGIYADFSLGAKVYQDVQEALKEFEIGILGMVNLYHTILAVTERVM